MRESVDQHVRECGVRSFIVTVFPLKSIINKSLTFVMIKDLTPFFSDRVPVVSPSAVLIPLREAINRTFADLLPRRHNIISNIKINNPHLDGISI